MPSGQVSGAGRQPDVQLMRGASGWLINGEDEVKLGFTWAQAARQRSTFAAQLLAIGNRVNALQEKNASDWQTEIEAAGASLLDNTDDFIDTLAPVLNLEPASKNSLAGIQTEMKEMRDSGTALWNLLDGDLKTKLRRDYGLLDSDPTQEHTQAQLAVRLPQFENSSAAPICWNMIYQEDADCPRNPWLFWGLRVAISQWPQHPRNGIIKVRPALTASDGMLPFACQEARLAKAFAGESESLTLEGELQKLAAKIAPLPDESKLPLSDQTWLKDVLLNLDPSYDPSGEMPEWLEDQLCTIFRQPYGLIHFSCHCLPDPTWDLDPTGERNPPERRLQITLAGGTIQLNQNFIINRLKLKKDGLLLRDDPGGLVFLNACGTGQQVASQFPDLPLTWIMFRRAKAVIATLCDVPDVFAYVFALKLYQNLKLAQDEYSDRRNKSLERQENLDPRPPQYLYLDAALLATRRFFMEKFNNPLGLAYELYAYPGARLEPQFQRGTS